MKNTENGRQAILPTVRRLLSIALFITLAVVVTNAQVACLGKCEQTLVLCINEGGQNFSGSCLEAYEQCVEACIGAAGAILD